MRVFMLVRPRHPIPPEAIGPIFQAFGAWREEYRDKMECFEFIVGGGGFAVTNFDNEADLNQMVVEFPLFPFSEVTTTPIVDGDLALQHAMQRFSQ